MEKRKKEREEEEKKSKILVKNYSVNYKEGDAYKNHLVYLDEKLIDSITTNYDDEDLIKLLISVANNKHYISTKADGTLTVFSIDNKGYEKVILTTHSSYYSDEMFYNILGKDLYSKEIINPLEGLKQYIGSKIGTIHSYDIGYFPKSLISDKEYYKKIKDNENYNKLFLLENLLKLKLDYDSEKLDVDWDFDNEVLTLKIGNNSSSFNLKNKNEIVKSKLIEHIVEISITEYNERKELFEPLTFIFSYYIQK